MNEELFNEAARSNVLSKKLIDQLQESMTYSSISLIHSFQKFVKANFSSYITSQVFKEISNPEKIYYTLTPCEDGYSLLMADSGDNKTYAWISSISKRFSLVQMIATGIVYIKDTRTDTYQPFISGNGKYCRYDKERGIIVEI